MKRFTTQIINRYKDAHDFTKVDRIDYRKGKESWCIIAKPGKDFVEKKKYNRCLGTSATNFGTAHKTNMEFALNRRSFGDFMQKLDSKIPNLIERRKLLADILQITQQKIVDTEDMILLTDAENNGGCITRIGYGEHPPEDEVEEVEIEESEMEDIFSDDVVEDKDDFINDSDDFDVDAPITKKEEKEPSEHDDTQKDLTF